MQRLKNLSSHIIMKVTSVSPGISWVIIFMVIVQWNSYGQCSPPLSSTCSAAIQLCSLDELNGLACANTSSIPGHCSPVCGQGGAPNNTSWWAFMGNGMNVSVSIAVGSCTASQGLEFGILRGCNCGSPVICKSVPCVAPGTTHTLNFQTEKCGSYSLWVDGCLGDVCDFTISTSGGGLQTLEPLGPINNETDLIIDACKDACSFHFFTNNPNDGCFIHYNWTLDGVELGGGEQDFYLDLPKEGDFEICVSQQLLNPKDLSTVCNEQGPQCATIKVRKYQDRLGVPRKICWEATYPNGFKWHNQFIQTSGQYRARLSDAKCCSFDSIVDFTLLEKPQVENIYHVSCDNTPYVDFLGRKYSSCLYRKEIIFSKSTSPYRCDSSILLTTMNLDLQPSWSVKCLGNFVELAPNVVVKKPCNLGETYSFNYRWFSKKDPSKLISHDERILVPAQSEDYFVELDVATSIDDYVKECTLIYSENFDESNVIPACLPVSGSKVYCFSPEGRYEIVGTLDSTVKAYHWRVEGGQLMSNADSQTVSVRWNLNTGDTGKICASYEVDCGMSCEKCLELVLDTKIAGQSFAQRGLTAYLDALPDSNGVWRLISGPSMVHLFEPTNPRTQISAFQYGLYCFEWTIHNALCTVRDTLCVDFYFAQRASPDYPHNDFKRNIRRNDQFEDRSVEINSPNFISTSGHIYVSLKGPVPATLNCTWYTLDGRMIEQSRVQNTSEIQPIEIRAPQQSGIYYLYLSGGEFLALKKICIIH